MRSRYTIYTSCQSYDLTHSQIVAALIRQTLDASQSLIDDREKQINTDKPTKPRQRM